MINRAWTSASAFRRAWPLLALPVLVAIVYWPGRGGGFAFDDYPNIVENTMLHVTTLDGGAWLAAVFSSPASDLQRPLAMASFAVNHYFTGLDPVPMKLTNLAIHALNSLLVLGLLRALLALPGASTVSQERTEWAARFGALAWGLHPINLMPVLLVVQRMESLAHAFVFGGLWLYLVGRRRQLCGEGGGAQVLIGVLGGTAAGLLAKESAVLLPLYAFLVEACLLGFRTPGGRLDARLLVFYTCVLLLPALIGIWWLWPKVTSPSAYAGRTFDLGERLLTEGRVVLDYLQWSLFPSLRQLSLYHDDYVISRGMLSPPSTLSAFVALSALLALAMWLRRRRPLSSLGLAWFLGAQLLTATVIPLELVYEHRNYFASLGICLVLADLLLLAPAPHLKRVGALIAVLFVGALGATTYLRAREWSDPYRFAATEAAKHPRSPRATYALGRMLVIMSGYRPDSPLLEPARQALEASRALPDSGILPHAALALLAANTSSPQQAEWWSDMQRRLREHPIGPQEIAAIGSLVHCARSTRCRFRGDWMQQTFQAAARTPAHPELLHLEGDYALNVFGDRQRALDLWREAARLDPQQVQYRLSVIKLLIALGRESEARRAIGDLRVLGRLGQHGRAADEMEARLESRLAASRTSGP